MIPAFPITTPQDGFTALDYLDTPTSLAIAAEQAKTAASPHYPEALMGTRAGRGAEIVAAIDMWAAQNHFQVRKVVYLNAGITVIVNSDDAPSFITDAPHPFDDVLAATALTAGWVRITDEGTDDEADY